MNINRKQVLLYGSDRLEKDFIYLFPKVKVVGYVINSEKEYNNQDKEFYKFHKLNKTILKNKMLIICLRKDDKIDKRLKKMGIIEKKHYYWFEDLGFLLNDKIDKLFEVLDTFHKIYVYKWDAYVSKHITNEELLKKMIYTDSYDGIKCEVPFKYMHVQPDGYAHSCCPGWAYNRAGNLLIKSPKSIWNSNSAKLFRLSIINKTYAFCNKVVCPYLKGKLERTTDRFENLETCQTPQEVYASIDYSCNLHCKSCRKEIYNAKGWELKRAEILSRKLIKSDWTSSSKKLVLAGQGEVFFSKVYRKMIFDSDITKRDSIEILTNGTLMTKDNLDKLTSIYNKIKIYVTVDAATENTYKKIRLGGNYKKLIENLEYLSKIRKDGKVERVELLFVVQKDNYEEMIDFIKLSKRLGFDKVSFSQIANWGTYTKEEFENVSMIKKDGKPKKELKAILDSRLLKESLYEHSNITKFIDE